MLYRTPQCRFSPLPAAQHPAVQERTPFAATLAQHRSADFQALPITRPRKSARGTFTPGEPLERSGWHSASLCSNESSTAARATRSARDGASGLRSSLSQHFALRVRRDPIIPGDVGLLPAAGPTTTRSSCLRLRQQRSDTTTNFYWPPFGLLNKSPWHQVTHSRLRIRRHCPFGRSDRTKHAAAGVHPVSRLTISESCSPFRRWTDGLRVEKR